MSKTVEMKKRFKEKRGVALLIAVLAMLMLTLFAIGFALETGTDIDVGRAYLEKVKTSYIAQAGMNRARNAISLNETGWTLSQSVAETITPPAESIGGGEFKVTASSEAVTGKVSITSEGGIPTALTGRTKRIAEEKVISRGGAVTLTATASTQQAGSLASSAIDTNNGGSKYSRGTPWRSQAGANPGQSQGAWIIIDFGTPVQFDYMIFVRDTVYTGGGVDDYRINRWSLDVCTPSDADCKTTGTGWASRVTPTMSTLEPLDDTGLKDTDIPAPGLLHGSYRYWVAVNFLKQGSTTTQTPDCDNNLATLDGFDHCTGVLPGAVGVQTTRQVKITADCVTTTSSTCSSPSISVFAEIDWIQFKNGGSLTFVSPNFSFNGTDVQGTSGLAAPKDFTER